MTTQDIGQAVEEAAARLLAAQTRRQPTWPVRDLIGSTDIDVAYQVQRRIIDARIDAGARVVGRKIGLTSEAVQRQVKVDRPDFGVLLDDMQFDDGELIPHGLLLQPRAEVEIAFALAEDLETALDGEAVRAAIAYASPAIEIVDSRVHGWDIAITDTVADNASSGAFVLGSAQVSLSDFEPRQVRMALTRAGETVSTGLGTASLGDPLTAVAWLAQTAVEYGAPLRAGEIILSGALGPLVPVLPGDTLVATVEPLGPVTTRFGKGEADE
jgi:2-keto-4-pentenoate hydratase